MAKLNRTLPIPLTCEPDIHNGKCSHALDSGACEQDNQFICPYFLWYEREHPEEVAGVVGYNVSMEDLTRVRSRQPYPIPGPDAYPDPKTAAKKEKRAKRR